MATLEVGLGAKKAAEGYPASLALELYILGINTLQAGTLGGGFKVKSMRHSLSLAGSNAYVNTLVRSQFDRGRGNLGAYWRRILCSLPLWVEVFRCIQCFGSCASVNKLAWSLTSNIAN